MASDSSFQFNGLSKLGQTIGLLDNLAFRVSQRTLRNTSLEETRKSDENNVKFTAVDMSKDGRLDKQLNQIGVFGDTPAGAHMPGAHSSPQCGNPNDVTVLCRFHNESVLEIKVIRCQDILYHGNCNLGGIIGSDAKVRIDIIRDDKRWASLSL